MQWVASHWSKLMALSSEAIPKKPSSFHPPQQPEWHRMIAEAAYFIAEKRRFVGEHSLDDWLAAEQQVRQVIQDRQMPQSPHSLPLSGPINSAPWSSSTLSRK